MISLQIQAHNDILRRHGEGFETLPAPNRNGSHEDRVMASRGIRPIRVEGNIAYVPLTRGYEAVIDAADVPLVDGAPWQAKIHRRADGTIRSIYASRRDPAGDGSRRHVLMHRIIAGTPDGAETDHIDGNGLHNWRTNLRTATKTQNQHNCRVRSDSTSGIKGVSWYPSTGKWRAAIRAYGQRRCLGVHKCRTAAALAYAKASRELHGDYGRTE